MTGKDVCRQLELFNKNTSAGPNGTHPSISKLLVNITVFPMSELFQASIYHEERLEERSGCGYT